MKKLIFPILLLLIATTAFSQFGIKGGLNASKVTDGNFESAGGRLGLQGGLMWQLKLTEKWDIRPELNYVQKGSRYKSSERKVGLLMDYLEVPIALVRKTKYPKITWHVGARFSYLINTDVTYTYFIDDEEIAFDIPEDNFNDFDFGLMLGVGFHHKNFMLEFRIAQNFIKYNKEVEFIEVEIDDRSTHYNLQISLGYSFGAE